MERRDPPKDAFTDGPRWSREQRILAFQLYCVTPFGQLDARNKKIIELARLIGRTPGALAMKCVNFASLDPKIRESGRTGLPNVSAGDREIWNEFHADWDGLVDECESLLAYLRGDTSVRDEPQDEIPADSEGSFSGETRAALVQQRLKQSFFRRAVLNGYRNKCCISGVSDTRLLVASHIVPWRDDASIRLHPGNGLCLSAIHDKAFDSLLFSLTDDHRIVLSKQLRATRDKFLQEVFWPTDDTTIALPERFVPEMGFVRHHRKRMLDADLQQ